MKFILSLSLKAKIIIAACAVAAAAVAGTVVILNSEEAYRVIRVFELNGSAVVTRENTGDIDAYAGMNLESGDILSVEENSSLRISLDSDKYILLDGGTVLKLIAQGTEADSRTVIDLQEGTILNEIQNPLSANSSYEVNTPKATMAVRGTIFSVTTRKNPDGSFVTDLYTAEGIVSVLLFDENGDPKGAETYVPKGGAVTILTEINNQTGNPANVDGDPHFVFRTDDGSLTDCGDSDPVYYPDSNNDALSETQTKQSDPSVLSDNGITETGETDHESEQTVALVTPKTGNEQADGTDSVSKETEPAGPIEPPAATEPTESIEPPAIIEPTESIEPPVTTEPAGPSESGGSGGSTESGGTSEPPATTEPTESTEPTEPTVYKISIIDENGNVISESECDENEMLGTLPPIADKKGYTGKWVSGGVEVTENTVISENMAITVEYSPRPVTVRICAPHDNNPYSTYGSILEFTVLYDSDFSDNDSGYTIDSLTEYVDSRYADYYNENGKDYVLNSINFGEDTGSVSDTTVISGDNVYDDGEKLYVDVYFNYGSSGGT